MKRIISAVLTAILLLNVTCFTAFADNADVIMLKEGDTVVLPFNIAEEDGYCIKIEYLALKGRNVPPKVAISWDRPYEGSESEVYTLSRVWSDVRSGERFKQDDYGNELSPTPEEKEKWQEIILFPQNSDWETGFKLIQGEHQLHLQMLEESVEISSVTVEKKEKLIDYREYISSVKNAGDSSKAETIHREAELLDEKSHLEVAVSYDRTSPNISPNDPALIRYNTLGGSSWSHAGEWVSYEIDVKESGFYNFDIKYRQRTISGVDVRRRIFIDGKVLFKELDCVMFPASNNFTTLTLGDKEAYKIYLEKGKHTVKFEVVLDSLNNVISEFETILDELNKLSSKINIIVGEGVDLNRDYDFVTAIPEIGSVLNNSADKLDNIVKGLGNDGDNEGSQMARISEAARLFREMAEKPNEIAKQIDYFRSQLYDLAGVLSTLKTQPIELDYFEIYPVNGTEHFKEKNIFNILGFRAKAFLYSFVGDYSSMSAVEGGKALDVWISLGRDQAQVLNQLISEEFTANTGIPVNLSLVTANILTAIASDKAPDVALNLDDNSIANLYYREALVDLSSMPDIDKILARFYPSAMTAFTYNNAIYALPQTQTFQMLFYRKDVFKEYGYSVPDTWEDMYALLNLLQNDGMQMGISISEATFNMLLLQSGVPLYNENMTATNLTETKAVKAFSDWTELFTKYGIPKSYDATNRFRTGQMPVVVSDYGFYKTLMVSAPEIKNSFAMAPVPGTVTEKGINRAEDCNLTGAVIIRKDGTDDYSTAMNFIDWLTSDGIQEKYSINSEIRVGISARVQTANKNVMENISWSSSELKALKEQWSQVERIPVSPAHYYITRNMNNAFRKVVYQYENPRDVIFRYSHEIDEELERKYEELRLEDKS